MLHLWRVQNVHDSHEWFLWRLVPLPAAQGNVDTFYASSKFGTSTQKKKKKQRNKKKIMLYHVLLALLSKFSVHLILFYFKFLWPLISG